MRVSLCVQKKAKVPRKPSAYNLYMGKQLGIWKEANPVRSPLLVPTNQSGPPVLYALYSLPYSTGGSNL